LQRSVNARAVRVRGIRGAVVAAADESDAILSATKRLLTEMRQRNEIASENIASVFFTLTPDLKAAFPAVGARELGWVAVPMLHSVEVDVPGALGRVIRVLLLANTERTQDEIQHVYLDEAAVLRPDLHDAGRS
jgi:chorismate mutase